MKFINHFILFSFLLILISCNNQNIVDAKIFERKEQEGNRLLIKYQYTIDGSQYIDSAIIENVVLEGDSIPVKFKVDNPQKAIPQIEK